MSGAPDYSVGDLVVCVKLNRPDKCGARIGGVYRVARLVPSVLLPGIWRVELEGVRPPLGYPGYNADRFRRVDPLPAALTSLLTSKPAREGVPA